MSDVTQALRAFRKTPGFTAVVVLTLGLGIGGSTAIFSVVNGVLLRPLPYPDADTIVSLQPRRAGSSESELAHTPADFLDLQRELQSFAAVAGYRGDVLDVTSAGAEPQRLSGVRVTNTFFDVFGVPAALGRTFTAADAPGGDRLVVLSDGAWRQQFGGDPDVIGTPVRVSGQPYLVSGVMPPAFRWPEEAQAWAMSDSPVPPSPIELERNLLEEREISYFHAVGRLKPGLSVDRARSDIRAVARRIGDRHPGSAGRTYELVPIREEMVGSIRQGLLVLLGAVGCVLLIACANVAGLLVARGITRQREVGIRTALGAPRNRIVRQLLVENLVLAAAGGALGLLLASWGTTGLVALIPENVPRLSEVAVDGRVALFAVAVTGLTGLLFGLAPALQTTNVNVIELLRDGGRTSSSHGSRRVRAALVAAQLAVAVVLLVGAGLMINSFMRLRSVDSGFAVEQIVVAPLALPASVYTNAERQAAFYRQLLDRLQTSPIARTAAVMFPRPFAPAGGVTSFETDGGAPLSDARRPRAQLGIASPNTFAALGMPLIGGRTFSEADVEGAPRVVIVNRALADRHWPGRNAVGQRITFDPRDGEKPAEWSTIVGVVGNTRPKALDQAPEPTVYFPYHQFSLPFMAVVIRGTQDTTAVARELRAHVRALDPNLPIDEVRTLGADVARAAAQPRFRTLVLGGFAAISLLLAAIGLYGQLSYIVTQRVREIGVRMALGATTRSVLGLVVGEGMRLVAIGAAAGLAASYAAGRLIAALLFDVSPTDSLTYAVVTAVLVLAACGACVIPALRAARVNPVSALRAD